MVRFYLHHRQRDPSRDPFIRRSTRGRVQLPVPSLFSVSSILLTATSTAAFAIAWSSPLKLEASARVIAIIVRVLQLHHYSQSANFIVISYSEPATRKVIHYCLAHHYGVVSRNFHSTLSAIGTRVPTSFSLFVGVSIAGFRTLTYKQGEARDAKDRHLGAHHVGDESSL
jgi:hypothetical protein